MSNFEKTLKFLHQQGWSYGLIRYLDLRIKEGVCQIDALQGDRREKGTGRTWTEAAGDLVRKIYNINDPIH